ncbi:MAG: tyrosine-type recombinase/integrase [Alphaproteobacteria bacterium]|nr:MAG: tyrosine-type recombinase/integrase [Alphaproteobacteria bacterium]
MILLNDFMRDPKYSSLFKIIHNCLCSEKVKHCLTEFSYNLFFKEGKSMNTVLAYLYDIKLSIDFFVSYKDEDFDIGSLAKLQKIDFRALYSKRKNNEDIKALSQKRLISAWKCFLQFMKLDNVVHDVKIQIHKRFPKAVNKSIIEHLLEVDGNWISYRNRALWGLLYGSGMRITEALNLNVGAFLEVNNKLKIIGKGNVIREVPIFDIVSNWIHSYLNVYPVAFNAESPLFIGKSLHRLSSQTAAHILRKWRVKHGISEKITPHSLRHSFASHVVSNKCNLKILQDVLGHKNLDTTSVYVHIEDQILEESFKKIMD